MGTTWARFLGLADGFSGRGGVLVRAVRAGALPRGPKHRILRTDDVPGVRGGGDQTEKEPGRSGLAELDHWSAGTGVPVPKLSYVGFCPFAYYLFLYKAG
jgi:hypothetical protein